MLARDHGHAQAADEDVGRVRDEGNDQAHGELCRVSMGRERYAHGEPHLAREPRVRPILASWDRRDGA